jgi:hypothetical protein
MTLLEKQFQFSKLFCILLNKAFELGFNVTISEVERPDFTAKKYKELGIGSESSLHRIKLAADINLFKGKTYLPKTEDHKTLGEFWESLSTKEYKCTWGGRFGDGNHYSIEHNGVR